MTGDLEVALVTEVFFGDPEGDQLTARLREAREEGAELAVLPELPLNSWAPAQAEASDDDAEAPEGPRHRRQARAAREAGVALLGGAIVRDPDTGRRHNTSLLFDADGSLLTSYRKLHIPDEEGFREARHYEGGSEPPEPVFGLSISVGIQICSDIQRPEGARLLSALGAGVILVPRCTPTASYDHWLMVMRAAAATCAAYVVSVNRPGPESDVPIGGPSVVVVPDGGVQLETTETLAVTTLRSDAVRRARTEYPGYLASRPEVFARGWLRAAQGGDAG